MFNSIYFFLAAIVLVAVFILLLPVVILDKSNPIRVAVRKQAQRANSYLILLQFKAEN